MTAGLELLRSRLEGIVPNGESFKARCPVKGHGKGLGDRKPSLSISPGNGSGPLINCFAGCTAEDVLGALDLTWPDILPPREDEPRRTKKKAAPITVADLAADKALPVDFLEGLGVRNTTNGVHIAYKRMDGGESRPRLRTALVAKDGSIWLPPKSGECLAYGLDRLFDAREHGYIVVVEGESDSWTLWYHGFPAMGIPGADNTGKIMVEHLVGIRTVYYVREPDQGGETFARGIKTRMSGIKFHGELREIRLDGTKDPNDLHKKDPARFKEAFQTALDASVPVALDKPKQVAVLEEEPEEITAFLDREYDVVQEIIGNGLLMRQSACLVRGWKKALKSWEASQIAICAALKYGYHCFPVTRASRVLLVQAEISPARYQARLAKLLQAHTGWTDAIKGKVYIKNGAPKLDGDSFEILKNWVDKIKPDLLVLDPIYKFLRFADENSHSSMRLVFERLDELKAMGCAILIVHHNRKAAAGESDSTSMGAARGAGWEEWADSIIALRRDNTNKNRVKMSFELRNAEEPPDIVVDRDPETMWGVMTEIAVDRRQKVTTLDVKDALLSMGGKAGSKTELGQVLMEKYAISERTAETRIDMAVQEGLIQPGDSIAGGKRIGYQVHIPSITETYLPYADN